MPQNAGDPDSCIADGVCDHEPKDSSASVSPSEKQSTADVSLFSGEVTKSATVEDTLPSDQPSYEQPFEDGLRRISTERPPSDATSLRNTVSRVTTDAEGNTYPEGGLRAWLVVLGSFMGFFGSLGLINSIGTFEAFIKEHQLKEVTSGKVGWIFGVYIFLTFLFGVQIGPLFDARGPFLLMLAGSILTISQIIALGWCTEFWHFMLTIGVAGGLGASLIFTPSVAAVGHWFLEKRGTATGIATTGGSIGGIVFPLTLQSLFPKIGFAWATRVVALICLVSVATACLLVRSRLPKKPISKDVLPDFRIFKDLELLVTTMGVFFIEFGCFIPIAYISSYAMAHGVSSKFSYQLLAIHNAGSSFGRWLPGYFSDFLGRFNMLIATVALCVVCTLCLWLPANGNLPLTIVYCVVFGFASGSNISLTPVCISQLTVIENYGRYYATVYTIVSFR